MDIKKIIFKAIFPNYFKKIAIHNFTIQSYSQEGEDLILDRILENKNNGFFIDIGAHHPQRFSNTFKFYLKGWRGINIDPIPGMKILFDSERPLDINLELGISNRNNLLTYYSFNEPALNTFDIHEASEKNKLDDYDIIEEIQIETYPLSTILNEYVQPGTLIDFMSIDVEGLDLEVLESNDWNLYKPKYILVEELRTDINEIILSSPINKFLCEKDYRLYYRTMNTSFYKLET